MKIRFCAALLMAALSICIFAGCAAGATAPETQAPTQAQPTAVPETAPPVIATEPTLPAATEAISNVPAPTESPKITREEAIAIALKDAGLTEDQVTRLRAEFDYDDGVPEYEVDFCHAGYEYDYEIHAETGVIRSRDKDRED